jgi:hypothetical protein
MNMPFSAGALGLMDATSNDCGAVAGAWSATAPVCDWARPDGDSIRPNNTVAMAIPAVTLRTLLIDFSLSCIFASIL